MDLRERVLQTVDEGVDTRKEIPGMSEVNTRWICKLIQQYRETGSIEPLPHGGGQQPKFTRESLERLEN